MVGWCFTSSVDWLKCRLSLEDCWCCVVWWKANQFACVCNFNFQHSTFNFQFEIFGIDLTVGSRLKVELCVQGDSIWRWHWQMHYILITWIWVWPVHKVLLVPLTKQIHAKPILIWLGFGWQWQHWVVAAEEYGCWSSFWSKLRIRFFQTSIDMVRL